MKIILIISLTCFSIFIACSQKHETKNDYSCLKGNWHFVFNSDIFEDSLNNYYELHIRDTTLQFCFLLNEGGIHTNYYIENDSLYLIPEPNESTSFNWISKIDIINDSIVKLKFADSTKNIILFRMHEKIYDPVDHFLAGNKKETFNAPEYDLKFKERAVKYVGSLYKRSQNE